MYVNNDLSRRDAVSALDLQAGAHRRSRPFRLVMLIGTIRVEAVPYSDCSIRQRSDKAATRDGTAPVELTPCP
ncbi:MAG: hypothetical protein JWO98_1952 [Frankiales bacterium]|nr:hypothetical protein [Frankiales bacterium]